MKNADLVGKMTLAEKLAFITGDGFWLTRTLPRLGLPAILLTDGPHGVRKIADVAQNSDFVGSVPTTAFPTASLSACSFDPELLEEMGRALAEESLRHGVGMLLGPGANIKRSPLCGRNFEYFSEDPLLSSALAAGWIRGLQERGVGASLKHFAVNNQERRRMTVDALVEERALREIYLASFEDAIKEANPASVMCAYNLVNGIRCSENPMLMRRILRDEWGYEGLVVTDWGASNDRALGIAAGIDLEMPEGAPSSATQVEAAIKKGVLPLARLDESVDRILTFVLSAPATGAGAEAAGKGGPTAGPDPGKPGADIEERHHALAGRIAAESMVLLKNEGDILPIAMDRPVALVGELARSPRYQGAGSSFLKPTRLVSLLDALRDGQPELRFAPGYSLGHDRTDAGLEAEALQLAGSVEAEGGILIVAIGLPPIFESEGFDREGLDLPASQLALLKGLSAACSRVVAVYSGGSPVSTDWLPGVRALLAGYLGGQAGGAAQADILYGRVNPSGKLAETWPLRLEDTPAYGNFPGEGDRVMYKEGLFVGYRWYASSGRPARFPFGYGLSYTRFSYSGLEAGRVNMAAGQTATFSFRVANVGSRTGAEIAQCYLSWPESGVERPLLSLAAFTKVRLEAGAEARVEFSIGTRALRHWNPALGAFEVEGGPVIVRCGGSSHDLPLEFTLYAEGGAAREDVSPRDLSNHPSAMSDEEFSQRLGRPIPPSRVGRPHDLDRPLGDLAADSRLARLIMGVVIRQATRTSVLGAGDANYRMMEEMVRELPVRKLPAMSGGVLPLSLMRMLVALANGRPFAAVVALFSRHDA
ncbi:MAG: glycoside hydrolase family 3 C-terminal domain-containing protein [Spirochaetota bacterium]